MTRNTQYDPIRVRGTAEDRVYGIPPDLRPVGPRLLVLRDPDENRTRGGLYIPGAARRPMFTGTVRALGAGARRRADGSWVPHVLRAGDRILFSPNVEHDFAGGRGELLIGAEIWVILTEDDVGAVIEDQADAAGGDARATKTGEAA